MVADAPSALAEPSLMRRIWRLLGNRRVRLILALLPALTIFGAFSPIFSPLIYSALAPAGWHNITPHGKTVLFGVASSVDTPGLILACGSSFTIAPTDPSTWLFGRLHFWLTHDGGTRWQLLHPPFENGDDCEVAAPPGGNGTLFAGILPKFSLTPPTTASTATLWVSHNAGTTWRRVTANTAGAGHWPHVDIGSYYRHGVLYGGRTVDSPDGSSSLFAMSIDDGATWTTIESAPSGLEQQGWQVDTNPLPDYRSELAWYRALSHSGQPPMLEHSRDDAHHWDVVGPIGTEPLRDVLLATTPHAPERLCAAHIAGQADHVSLLSSADGGHTWRTGMNPPNTPSTSGEMYWLEISTGGDCYQGYHYRIVSPGKSQTLLGYGVWHLGADSTVMRILPMGNDMNLDDSATAYVPAGAGLPSRLIVEPMLADHTWAAVFSGLAGENNDQRILWHAAP